MRFVDLSGKKFGRLTAIRREGYVGKFIQWGCACDCGRYVKIQRNNLVSGHSSSCGCWKCNRMKGAMSSEDFSTHIALMYEYQYKNQGLQEKVC